MKKTVKQLHKFLTMTESEVIAHFASLPNAQLIQCGKQIGAAVYRPGTRDDRVLCVAHCDTVWNDRPVDPALVGSQLESANTVLGIGADDRAGCCALSELVDSGHSLLICPSEETGCRGSQHLAIHFKNLLKSHRYAVQFDRCGSRDLVTYDCDNADFNSFLSGELPGYHHQLGSFSDISVLCPALGIAGVNISIGFRNEHTAYESLDVLDYVRTITLAKAMLADKQPDTFPYIAAVTNPYTMNGWPTSDNPWAEDPNEPDFFMCDGCGQTCTPSDASDFDRECIFCGGELEGAYDE